MNSVHHSTRGVDPVNLDTLTPAAYAQLPRHIQVNIPDHVLDRLRTDLELEFVDLRRRHRQWERSQIHIHEQANQALRDRLTPVVRRGKTHTEDRGHLPGRYPSKPCPDTRNFGVQRERSIRLVRGPCNKRACPVCGAHWRDLHIEGIGYRIEEAQAKGASFWAYDLGPDQGGCWKTGIKRARRKGAEIDGVSIPVGLDGTRLVLLARTCDTEISPSIPGTRIDNPEAWIDLALHAATSAAAEREDIPGEHRPPELGPISGYGEWKGNLKPYLGPEPETTGKVKYEFLRFPDQAKLVQLAMEAGMTVKKTPDGLVEVWEREPGSEAKFISQLEVIEHRDPETAPDWVHEPDWIDPF